MLVPLGARNLIKKVLLLSRAKLIYQRITLTRHTSFYFLFTLCTCLILSALQGVILHDNTRAVRILDDVVAKSGVSPHLTRIVEKDDNSKVLEVCNGVPGQDGVVCRPVINMDEGSPELQRRKREIYSRIARRQAQPSTIPDDDDEAEEGAEGSEEESAESDSESSASGDDPNNSSVSSDSDDGEESADGDDDDDEVSGSVIPTASVTISDILQSTLSPLPVTTANPTSTILATSTFTSTGSATTVVFFSTYTVSATPAPTVEVTVTTSAPTPVQTTPVSLPTGRTANQQTNVVFTDNCVYALSWLGDGIHDSQVEDVVILFAQLWMMTIGLVAILNESLPHLGAAFFAHVLAAAWAASRIQATRNLTQLYRSVIVPRACLGEDVLQGWWEERMTHSIPVAVLNAVSIVALGLFTWKLFTVYVNETLSRVGASPRVYNMYKLLLFFSVGLQLSSFFAGASAAMWISKMSTMRAFASHWRLYIVVFVAFFVFVLPWVVLGWRSVRKESKKQVTAFFIISALLVTICSVMFASLLYRTLFMRWTFFAAVTVTSFIFLVVTIALGIVCTMQFGKGLADYLDVKAVLEGSDFTPVSYGANGGLNEKRGFSDSQQSSPPPVWATWDSEKSVGGGFGYEFPRDEKVDPESMYGGITQPMPAYHVRQPSLDPFLTSQERASGRSASIYSTNATETIKLSSSPPIIVEASRWSEYTDDPKAGASVHTRRTSVETTKTRRSSGLLSRLNVFSAAEPKHVSVVSQYDHAPLVVANPDERRASAVLSVFSRSGGPPVLPPVPIPTINTIPNPFDDARSERGVRRNSGSSMSSDESSGSVRRGMVSAFPAIPKRNLV